MTNNKFQDAFQLGRQESKNILENLARTLASNPYTPPEIPDPLPFPPEWEDRAKPSDRFSHILPLSSAIQECGCVLFPDLWQERDWYARSKKEQDWWSNRERNAYALRLAAERDGLNLRTFGADFSNDPEQESLAYERKQEVYKNLIGWLNVKQIDCFILDESGNKTLVPAGIWLTDFAHRLFDSGRVSGEIIAPDRVYGPDFEAIWVEREQLSKQLQNLTIPRMSKKAALIAEAALVDAYKAHVKEHEKSQTIPTWKQDQEAIERRLGKKPTDAKIKQIRCGHAPEHWKKRGRRKEK